MLLVTVISISCDKDEAPQIDDQNLTKYRWQAMDIYTTKTGTNLLTALPPFNENTQVVFKSDKTYETDFPLQTGTWALDKTNMKLTVTAGLVTNVFIITKLTATELQMYSETSLGKAYLEFVKI